MYNYKYISVNKKVVIGDREIVENEALLDSFAHMNDKRPSNWKDYLDYLGSALVFNVGRIEIL